MHRLADPQVKAAPPPDAGASGGGLELEGAELALPSRIVLRLSRRLARTGAILAYHGVTTPESPSAGIANIPDREFAVTLAAARRMGEVVPLAELVERHAAGRSTRGLLGVTFDDAYASLLETVVPMIERDQVPITVFVTSGASRTGERFWWDRIEDLHPRVAPERWRSFEDALGLPEEFRRGEPPEFGPLRPLRQWLLAGHAGRLTPAADALLSALEAETGWRTGQRAMRFGEVARLLARPWIDIGVHTVTHPVLPLLDGAEAEAEIAGCFLELRDHFPRVLPMLAFPYGLFDRRTVRAARAAGMRACFSADNLTLARCVEPDVLPRFVVAVRQKPWKLALRLAGAVERVRGPRHPGYSVLPAATA